MIGPPLRCSFDSEARSTYRSLALQLPWSDPICDLQERFVDSGVVFALGSSFSWGCSLRAPVSGLC